MSRFQSSSARGAPGAGAVESAVQAAAQSPTPPVARALRRLATPPVAVIQRQMAQTPHLDRSSPWAAVVEVGMQTVRSLQLPTQPTETTATGDVDDLEGRREVTPLTSTAELSPARRPVLLVPLPTVTQVARARAVRTTAAVAVAAPPQLGECAPSCCRYQQWQSWWWTWRRRGGD